MTSKYSHKRKPINLFHRMAAHSIAYKNILKENNCHAKNFSSADWSKIPLTDKNSYINKYSLDKLILDNNDVSNYYMICSSSGSTGKPTLWPRDFSLDRSDEKPHTEFLNSNFDIVKKKTLVVILFGLGTATAGLMHVRLSWMLNKYGNITVVTPGENFDMAADLIEMLSESYEQTVIIGYPPLIEQCLSSAVSKKHKIEHWNLKIAYAGAGVSNNWRNKILEITKQKFSSIMAFYGCTETGMVGFENKSINKLSQFLLQSPNILQDTFKTKFLPTIIVPKIRRNFLEIVDNELVLTVDQPIPLMRYNLHDKALLFSYDELYSLMKKYSYSFKDNISNTYLFIFGREEQSSLNFSQLRDSIERINTKKILKDEFQYKLETNGIKNILTVRLYIKNHNQLSSKNKTDIKQMLLKSLNISHQNLFTIKIEFCDEKDRIGYINGKLRYNLS